MARANGHTFQLPAKRYGRMRSLLSRPSFRYNLPHLAVAAAERLAAVYLNAAASRSPS